MSMLKFVAAGLLVVAAPALADSPFDGTWKAQLPSVTMKAKPQTYSLKGGSYSCATCTPTAYTIPADGQFHAVAGRDYWDDLAIDVVDDHTVRYRFRKAGQVVSTNTYTVSADGRALATQAHNTNNGGGVPIDSAGSAARVGAVVPGAHLLSGSWQFAPASSVSDAALTMTLALDGDRFHQASGLGETLDATVGGAFAPNVGDPGKTMTKVERLGPRVLKMTDMRGGKVVSVAIYTVSADGATLTGKYRDSDTGQSGGFTAVKQ